MENSTVPQMYTIAHSRACDHMVLVVTSCDKVCGCSQGGYTIRIWISAGSHEVCNRFQEDGVVTQIPPT